MIYNKTNHKIVFIHFILLLLLSCAPWSTLSSDIDYVETMTSQELRNRLSKNDAIITKNILQKTISNKLQLAVYDTMRIYSGVMKSPSFQPNQIHIYTSQIPSYFHPFSKSVYFAKDDLRYFNIHGVLIHESVGHSVDQHVYPLTRFWDQLKIFPQHPLRILELRAIASVPAVWNKIHQQLEMPYKPWNILHPVAGSLDCEDVFDWFFQKPSPWKKSKSVTSLKKAIANEDTESIPHLLARVYLLILANKYNSVDLWKYTLSNNATKIEADLDQILKQKTIGQAMNDGLTRKYIEYLDKLGLHTYEIANLMLRQKPQIHTKYSSIYNLSIGKKSIEWVDRKPKGLSWNDNFTWHFSVGDSFEDAGCDGPNFEQVLGNEDCKKLDYFIIWKKCSQLSELVLRHFSNSQ